MSAVCAAEAGTPGLRVASVVADHHFDERLPLPHLTAAAAAEVAARRGEEMGVLLAPAAQQRAPVGRPHLLNFGAVLSRQRGVDLCPDGRESDDREGQGRSRPDLSWVGGHGRLSFVAGTSVITYGARAGLPECIVNHSYLSELLDYHYWAQERVFEAVEHLSPEQFTRDLGNSFPSVRDTLVHIHFAECIWYTRWQHESLPMPSAEAFPDLESVREASKKHEVRMRALLERLGQDGINQSMDYTSRLDGEESRDRSFGRCSNTSSITGRTIADR